MACLIMLPFILLLVIVGVFQAGVAGIGGVKGVIAAILIGVIYWGISLFLRKKETLVIIKESPVEDKKDDLESRTTEVRDE